MSWEYSHQIETCKSHDVLLVDFVTGTDCATAGVHPRVKDSLIGLTLLLCPVHTHTQFRASDARSIQFSAFRNVCLCMSYYVDTDSRNACTQSNTYACETLQIPIAQAAPYGNVPTAAPMAAAGPPPPYAQPVSARA